MARVQKMSYSEINEILNVFSQEARAKYDSYAFPTGFLQSVLTSIVADMPVVKQQQIMRQFRDWNSGR